MEKYCKNCGEEVQQELYETGIEEFCRCQCTLEPDFNPDLWTNNLLERKRKIARDLKDRMKKEWTGLNGQDYQEQTPLESFENE